MAEIKHGSAAVMEPEKGFTSTEVETEMRRASMVNSIHIGEMEGTKRGLKSRHAQMIALGGTIGTGLFVGSGSGLRIGGPVSFFLCYLLITFGVFGIVSATTELSSYLPVTGCSVNYYANRYVSKSLGFALGWMYWYIFVITVPAEITAASIVVRYWTNTVPIGAWLTIFLFVIIGLNTMPVRFFGEIEFWFASIKVFGIIGLLIMAFVLVVAGGPSEGRLGFSNWTNPAPFNEYLVSGASGRLVGFISTITFSVFAFGFAPELIVVTGGEMENPRRNLPTAGKRYFIRLVLFYVLGALAISLIISSRDPSLLGGGSGAGASPWALAAKNAGIKGLDSVINAVILTSAWSSGNGYLYLSSRALYSLAVTGNAPRIFTKCTKQGVPWVAAGTSAVFCLLAYLNLSSSGAVVFGWFVNLINTGAFTSWIMVCVIYVRYRKAANAQNITDLPYRSKLQPVMSYVSGTLFFVLMLLSGFTVFLNGQWNTSNFITAYVGIPIFLAFYFGHRFTKGRHDRWWYRPEEVDLITGLQDVKDNETPPPPRTGSKWTRWMKALWE